MKILKHDLCPRVLNLIHRRLMHLITGSKFWRARNGLSLSLSLSLPFSFFLSFFLLTFRRRKKWMTRFAFDDKNTTLLHDAFAVRRIEFFYTRCICPRRNLILIFTSSGIVSTRVAGRFKISETGTKRQKVTKLNFNSWWDCFETDCSKI